MLLRSWVDLAAHLYLISPSSKQKRRQSNKYGGVSISMRYVTDPLFQHSPKTFVDCLATSLLRGSDNTCKQLHTPSVGLLVKILNNQSMDYNRKTIENLSFVQIYRWIRFYVFMSLSMFCTYVF